MKEYVTKQSGEKAAYSSGMQRDQSTGKPRPDLITDEMILSIVGLSTPSAMVVSIFREWRAGSDFALSSLLRSIKDFGCLKPEEMALRLGGVLERGGRYYGYWNWQKANSQEELDRFYESAERHLVQWLGGIDDEDHLAGALFNIMCAEYLRNKLKGKK